MMTTLAREKVVDVFGEVCIDKTLVSAAGIGTGSSRTIPTFVAEWLVDRYCRTGVLDDDAKVRIHQFIREHLPTKDQKNDIKYALKSGKSLVLLDYYSVSVDLRTNRLCLRIPCIDEPKACIERFIVDENPMLLIRGIWGAGRLTYRPPSSGTRSGQGEVWMIDFKPMQVRALDLDYYCQAREEFSLVEWLDLLITSIGYNPEVYNTPRRQLTLLGRLIPLVHGRVNLIEIAPKGTGKSYVYTNLSRHVWTVSGGKISAAVLFYDERGKGTEGLLTRCDVIALDEVQTLSFDNPGLVVGTLKVYMEAGEFRKGNFRATSDCGIVMLGNIPIDSGGRPTSQLLLETLPPFLRETAFLDRIHGILPGWELPRISVEALATGVGFKADFFGEVLHALRNRTDDLEYVKSHARITGTDDLRDVRAIQRLAAGYLKLLFPSLNPTSNEFYEYCVQPAISLRQRVRDQLCQMDAEYKQLLIGAEVK